MTASIILAGINRAIANGNIINDNPESFIRWIQRASPKQLVLWRNAKLLHSDFDKYLTWHCISYKFAVGWADAQLKNPKKMKKNYEELREIMPEMPETFDADILLGDTPIWVSHDKYVNDKGETVVREIFLMNR